MTDEEIKRLIWTAILETQGKDEPLVHGPQGTCYLKVGTVIDAIHLAVKRLHEAKAI